MNLPRKSLFSVMLVGALFGTPALASAPGAAGPGGSGHPPAIHLATLPQSEWRRRRIRGAKVRAIVRRFGRRAGGSVTAVRGRRERLHPRLPPHDSYARGPPRSSAD
jgi:hypothetical protein